MKNRTAAYFKNQGVARNKKPLKNQLFHVFVKEVSLVSDEQRERIVEKYGIGDGKWLDITYSLEGDNMQYKDLDLTVEKLKEKVSEAAWAKFKRKLSQGVLEYKFVVQRRVNGKNIKP